MRLFQGKHYRLSGPRGHIVIRETVLRGESMRPVPLHCPLVLHVAFVAHQRYQRWLIVSVNEILDPTEPLV